MHERGRDWVEAATLPQKEVEQFLLLPTRSRLAPTQDRAYNPCKLEWQGRHLGSAGRIQLGMEDKHSPI